MSVRTPRGGGQRAVRVVGATAAGLLGLVGVRYALPAGTPRIRRPRTAGSAGSIAVLEKVRIGGSDQWVLGKVPGHCNPIVLYLHGGPGTSQLTSNRRDTKRLEQFFTVVNWDQRGAGKSYRAITDLAGMTIDQFVHDTVELTRYLLSKFHQERLVLVGHSWGTVIGATAVARHPELYHCYVGIGEIGNMKEGEPVSYQWTLDRAREHQAGRPEPAKPRGRSCSPPPTRP